VKTDKVILAGGSFARRVPGRSGDEIAATEPDLRGGTADRKRIK